MTRLHDIKITRRKLGDLGSRLREARQNRDLSQPAVARLLGKSKQLVSAWENGGAEITSTTIAAFAQHLGCDLNYLLLGSPGSAHTSPTHSNLVSVVSVPLFSTAQVIQLAEGYAPEPDKRIVPNFAVSDAAFSHQLTDESMSPQFGQGEIVVIDPNHPIHPSSIVAATVARASGKKFPLPTLVIRQIRFDSPIIGHAPYKLIALASAWPMIEITGEKDARLLGALVGSIRSRIASIE